MPGGGSNAKCERSAKTRGKCVLNLVAEGPLGALESISGKQDEESKCQDGTLSLRPQGEAVRMSVALDPCPAVCWPGRQRFT